MKNIKYMLILLIALLLPTFVSAFTKMEASTQNPIVGEFVYVRVNLDYGVDKTIKEIHFRVTYDEDSLQLVDQPMWTQERSSNGEYVLDYGSVTVDKTNSTDPWESGAVIQIKFKVLKQNQTVIKVYREGDAYYGDGNIIPHENASSITIYGKEPNSNTQLRSLTIEGYRLNPVFSVSKRDYYLTVGAEVDYVNIEVQRGDSTQIIEGDGLREIHYGLNKLDVVVKAQNGNTDTYHIQVTRSDNRTGDTSLKDISVSNSDLVFEAGKTEFTTTVSRSVDNVLLSASATDPNATLVGTGRKQLEIGKNEFTLTVSSSNGLITEYKVTIYRSSEEIKRADKSNKLLSLKVNGIVFDLNNGKMEFLYTIPNEATKLDITTLTESKTAKVNITGNENLKVGINKIVVKVTENDETESEYIIVVYKNPNAEVVKDLKEANYYSDSIYETTTPTLIPKTVSEKLKKNNSTLYYTVENMYGGLLYQIALKNNLNADINPAITRVNDSNLKYEMSIPENNVVTLYLDDVFKDGNDVKITTYDDTGSSRVITEGLRVDNGYVTFTTNGDKYYVFTKSIPITRNNSIIDIIMKNKIVIIIVIAVILVVVLLTAGKKKKEPVQKEPLY